MKTLGIALLTIRIHRGTQIKVKPDWNRCKRESKHLQAGAIACVTRDAGPAVQEFRGRCVDEDGREGHVSKVSACECGAAGPGSESSPTRCNFFCFIRLFWNQTFTCVSLSCRALATSTRLARVRYLLKWNSFSSSVSCLVLKLILEALGTVGWSPVKMPLLPASTAPRSEPTTLNPQVMCILAGNRGHENSRHAISISFPQILLNKSTRRCPENNIRYFFQSWNSNNYCIINLNQRICGFDFYKSSGNASTIHYRWPCNFCDNQEYNVFLNFVFTICLDKKWAEQISRRSKILSPRKWRNWPCAKLLI